MDEGYSRSQWRKRKEKEEFDEESEIGIYLYWEREREKGGKWRKLVGNNQKDRDDEELDGWRGVVFWVAGRLVLPWDTIVIPLRTASIRSRDSIEKSNAYLLLATLAFFSFSFARIVRAKLVEGTRLISLGRLASPPLLSISRPFRVPLPSLFSR